MMDIFQLSLKIKNNILIYNDIVERYNIEVKFIE